MSAPTVRVFLLATATAILLALIPLTGAHADGKAILALTTSQVAPEGETTISLRYWPSGEPVYSVDMEISYDASLVTAGLISPLGLLEGWSVVSNVNEPGMIRIALATGNRPLSEAGDLLTLTFAASTDHGESPISLERVAVNEAAITVVNLDGLISVRANPMICQHILLEPGWNLTSIAVTPTDGSPPEVLQSVSEKADRVLGENGVYVPLLDPVFNSLDTMSPFKSYYILLSGSQPVAWVICGTSVSPTSAILLEAGWNWIGDRATDSLPVRDALISIEGAYQRVLSVDQVYAPALPQHSTLTEMSPGMGYLIYMNQAATLTYPTDSIDVSGIRR